jgi:hypothetical protein
MYQSEKNTNRQTCSLAGRGRTVNGLIALILLCITTLALQKKVFLNTVVAPVDVYQQGIHRLLDVDTPNYQSGQDSSALSQQSSPNEIISVSVVRGPCTLSVTVQPSTAMCCKYTYVLNMTIHVDGPQPKCDGSYAVIRVINKESDFQTAFDYWLGNAEYTMFGQNRSLEEEPRTMSKQNFLPFTGSYGIDIKYKAIDYEGLLARNEGLNVKNASRSESRLQVYPWISLSNSTKYCAIECEHQISAGQQPSGGWMKRQEFIPSLGHPTLKDRIGNVSNFLKEHSSAGVGIIGASRPRTIFNDILQLSGTDVHRRPGKKAHHNLNATTDTDVPLHYFWYDPFSHLKFAKMSTVEKKRKPTIIAEMTAWLNKTGLCSRHHPTDHPSTIIYCSGSDIISRAFAPHDLLDGASYVRDELTFLKTSCQESQARIVVAAEMAALDGNFSPSANSFRNNRILAFNRLIQDVSRDLNLMWIDVYSPSLSGGMSTWNTWDIAHYYDKKNSFYGDAVSKNAALQYVWSTRRE